MLTLIAFPDVLQRECFTVFKEGENYKSGIISLMTSFRFPEERKSFLQDDPREKDSSPYYNAFNVN